MICPVEACDRPAHPDWTICRQHAWQLERDLSDAPALTDELDLTLSRQRASASNDAGRSADKPLPFDTHASLALSTLRQILLAWVRALGVRTYPSDNPDQLAKILLARHHHLIVRIDAHTAVQDIGAVCREGWRVVQPNSRGRIALPDPCPEPGCGARLWASMHDVGDPRPNLVWCEGPQRHEWRPEQWLRLGHRLGYGRTA